VPSTAASSPGKQASRSSPRTLINAGRTLDPLPQHTRLAQHPLMMRERRLTDRQLGCVTQVDRATRRTSPTFAPFLTALGAPDDTPPFLP
jgi:hypothetical protein